MVEKLNTAKKIYFIFFFGLMIALGIAATFLFVQDRTSVDTSDKVQTVSFLEQYPFEENEAETSSNEKMNLSIIPKYWDLVQLIVNGTNKYLTTLNPLYEAFTGVQKFFYDCSYSGLVLSGSLILVRLSNGYLAECCDYCPSSKANSNILDFSAWLEDMDIPFVSLITPDKSDDSITVFPKGVRHGYTQMLDEYKDLMDANGVKYIESKQTLLGENDDFYSWFYKSDNHWNVNAAYTMARETARYLNDELSVPEDTDALNKENFKLTVYKDSLLGAYGKKFGKKFGKKLGNAWREDMEVWYPTTVTDFHVEVSQYGIDKTGSFENTLVDRELLNSDTCSYNVFLYGGYPLVHIENNNCQNGTKILVIGFSFGNSLCPYLACSNQYIDLIDPRCFDGSIRSYIKQTKPDCVILCAGVPTENDESSLLLK